MSHSEINKNLPEGATPLDPDEAEDLRPGHIRTRGELNVWEQENILVSVSWIPRARSKALDEATIRELHRRMFSETWKWAGAFRLSDKTIGIHWPQIPEAVRNFVEDGRFWLREGTFSPDESAIRLHHRLAQIHPFPNGNGRHARLWSDMLLLQNGRPPISWGGRNLETGSEARKKYIRALQRADEGDYRPLLDLFLRDRPSDP